MSVATVGIDNDVLNRRVAEEVWNAGNLALTDELIAPDWALHAPGTPDPGRGPAGYRRWVAGFRAAFPDLRMTPYDMIADGKCVAFHAVTTGTHCGPFFRIPPTGKAIRVRGAGQMRIVGGKMVEHHAVADIYALLQQLGVTISPPAPAE